MIETKVSPYRWVVILAIIPIIISTEMMWLTLAPISSMAESFYNVSGMEIALFSMSYMIMFIIFSIPASWVVDNLGYRHSLIFGSILTAVFGLARFIFVDNFTILLISQFIIAIGQPFLLNISTKVPANWFPISERSTAAGLLIMAQYIGFAVPMAVAPSLANTYGIPTLFKVFAIFGIVSALAAIILTKEKPEYSPSDEETIKEDLSMASMKKLLKNRNYLKVLIICFISIGIFNTLLTLIESILTPRNITNTQAGIVGALFVIAGIVGAVILPLISDKLKIRIKIIVIALVLLVPFYLGLTFIPSFIFVSIVAFLTGFTVMGVAPILFQHGSEIAYPIQEGTSLGVVLLMGQISGVLFVAGFELLSSKLGSIILPMLLIVIMSAIEIPIALGMKESKINSSK